MAVKALEPHACGETITSYLKWCDVRVSRAAVYSQLSGLKADKYIRVAKRNGNTRELETTAKGQRAAHKWVQMLCKLAQV